MLALRGWSWRARTNGTSSVTASADIADIAATEARHKTGGGLAAG
jgi:hypothetical protein